MESDSDDDSVHSDSTSLDGHDETIRFGDEGSAPADTYDEYKEALRAGDAYILYFRSESTEALERVWIAAARAVAAMPALCAMTVGMSVSPCPRTNTQSQEFGFSYNAKDNPHFETRVPAHVPQLHWNTPNGWTMSKNLHALWRKVLGPEGEVTYEHW